MVGPCHLMPFAYALFPGLCLYTQNQVLDLLDIAIDAGAEECHSDNEIHEIHCEKNKIYEVKKKLEMTVKNFISTEIEWIPINNVIISKGIFDEISDFLDSLDINWESPQVLNYLAYGWIERDIFLDESLEMLILAHDQYPESHYILDSLAWAHFKKNNFELASKLMEEVILKAPGEAISLDHLGDIYFALGRKREAYYMWKQAYDLAKPEDDIIDSLEIKIEKYNAG